MTALGNVPLPSGRHVAWRDWDSRSLARCANTCFCPACFPDGYAEHDAKHRADVAA